tara:strand:+ start:110 stop:817 length:708 start_codon:yes stop_codon:yes gene_type:complete
MKNNTKKNGTKKIHKKKGGTGILLDELNNNKVQKRKELNLKKKDKIDKFLSKEDTILINPKTGRVISPKSLFLVLKTYTDAAEVDKLTENDLYNAYIIWSNKEAVTRRRNRKRGKKSGNDETPLTRKRKPESIETEELAEAAKHAAEEQKKIDDMNTYGTLYYPTPRSPTRTMVIDDYPHGFTPHGTKRQRKNSLSMTTPQDLFVNQEISEEPYDIDSLFNSSDMPSPLIPTPDI